MARTPTNSTPEDQPDAPSREDEILMREIDEAVRQDDTVQFFQKYGVAVGSSIALILVGMLGYWWWDSTSEAALEAESEAVISALDSVEAGDFAAVDEKVAVLVDEGSIGARSMSRFLQAGSAIEQGETERAVELYAAIAADTEAPQALRDLALIREVSTNFDDRAPEDVIAKLSSLAEPGNPYFGSAGELVAIAHLEAGNREEAGALFSAISQDEEMPQTLRNRTRQMAGLLGVDAIEDVEELLEEQGARAQN
ncbi:MAG: tetratricopeptide repeat protein [Pseudomonadota bacterium]